MPYVKTRVATIQVSYRRWHVSISKIARRASGAIIDRVRPSERGECLYPTLETSLKLNLKGVIIRRGGVRDEIHRSEIWVRPDHVFALQQTPARRADVGGRHRLLCPDTLLHGYIPLETVRKPKARIHCIERTLRKTVGRYGRWCGCI